MPGLVRVTVAVPGRRTDLAVPADLPVAALLPELARQVFAPAAGPAPTVGSPAGAATGANGSPQAAAQAPPAPGPAGPLELVTLNGRPVDPERSLAEQAIIDGTLLRLVPPGHRVPPPVHDDVAEAVADAAGRPGEAGRAAGAVRVTLLTVALVLWSLAPVLPVLPPPAAEAAGAGAGGIVPSVLAVLFAAAAVARDRLRADPVGALVPGVAALPSAFCAGHALGSQQPGAVPFVAGCCALLVMATLLAVVLTRRRAPFVAAAVAASPAAVAAAGQAVFAWRADQSAAVVVAAAVGFAAFAPALAARAVVPARGRVPSFAEVQERVGRADDVLTGLAGGCALAGGGGLLVLVAGGGPWAGTLAVAGGVALAGRARLFRRPRQVVPLLAAGLAGPVALLAGLAAGPGTDPGVRGLWLPGLAVAAGAFAVAGADVVPSGRLSPPARRCADLADAAARLAVPPLALAVLGVFPAVRALAA